MQESSIRIYHNPRCSKSRECLAWLTEQGKEVEVIQYLKTPPSITELKALLAKLGISAEEVLRKKEAIYKEQYKEKTLSEAEWLAVIHQEPKLLERPIVELQDKAAIGRSLQHVIDLF